MRLGLCCQFVGYPIRFRRATATAVKKLDREVGLQKIGELVLHNANALVDALGVCNVLGIRAFRIGSDIWPLYTHPDLGYTLDDLPSGSAAIARLGDARELAMRSGIRLSFHPDQFTVLSSPRPEVIDSAFRDLAYMADVAELVGADVVNVHAGGVYGDKSAALARLVESIERLPERSRRRLTLENDDVSYTPSDLLPVCRATGIPLVYDVHHHRCLPDALSVEEATELALSTWDREPHFHISSPRDPLPRNQRPHADFIEPADFPDIWRELDITVDVEAKSKEEAVVTLGRALGAGLRH